MWQWLLDVILFVRSKDRVMALMEAQSARISRLEAEIESRDEVLRVINLSYEKHERHPDA